MKHSDSVAVAQSTQSSPPGDRQPPWGSGSHLRGAKSRVQACARSWGALEQAGAAVPWGSWAGEEPCRLQGCLPNCCHRPGGSA